MVKDWSRSQKQAKTALVLFHRHHRLVLVDRHRLALVGHHRLAMVPRRLAMAVGKRLSLMLVTVVVAISERQVAALEAERWLSDQE